MYVDFRNYNTKRKPEFRISPRTRKYCKNKEVIQHKIIMKYQKTEEETYKFTQNQENKPQTT